MTVPRNMTSLFAAMAMAIMMIPTASAQDFDEEHLALAREAMTATRSTRFFDNILPVLAEEVRDTFARIDPSLTPLIEEKTLETALELVDRRRELDQRFAEMWASEFSREELIDIRDFLTSETGEKFTRLSGEITQRQTEVAGEWTSELSGEFVTIVRRKLRDLGHNL